MCGGGGGEGDRGPGVGWYLREEGERGGGISMCSRRQVSCKFLRERGPLKVSFVCLHGFLYYYSVRSQEDICSTIFLRNYKFMAKLNRKYRDLPIHPFLL